MSVKSEDDLRISEMKSIYWSRKIGKLDLKIVNLQNKLDDLEHRVGMCMTGILSKEEMMDQIGIMDRILS